MTNKLIILILIVGVIYLTFASYILILEDKGIIGSLAGSFRLVNQNAQKVFLYSILLAALTIVAGTIYSLLIIGSIILFRFFWTVD